jgi:hypothetical protein
VSDHNKISNPANEMTPDEREQEYVRRLREALEEMKSGVLKKKKAPSDEIPEKLPTGS